jgi:mRNA-degrading endonuclease RelE of RelBE toxin-antitoxin system
MDKVKKAIAKLPKKYQAAFNALMLKLWARDFSGLNMIKLKGHKDLFRVKKGRLRVIFRLINDSLEVLDVDLRSEKTYRKF